MPMLTSFKGHLDCEMAATTALDTNMVILTPTMNGVIKIQGRDVSVEGSPSRGPARRLSTPAAP